MDFKENIRYLRKQKNLTQEDLANQFDVSFQTVSKWENGVSMPDIGMLPLLADYFEISIDELLGYNPNDRQKKSSNIAREAHSLAENGRFLEAYRYLEMKIKHFKMDISLQHLMGYIAYQYAKEIIGDEKMMFLTKAIQQAEIVIKLDQNESSRTAQAKLLKCFCHNEMGNRKTALEIAKKLPSMFSSREVALFRCAEGSDKKQYAAHLEMYIEELKKEIIELS